MVTRERRVDPTPREGSAWFGRTFPLALALTAAVGLAAERGSIAAVDWLPYALATGLLVTAVLLSGGAIRPSRAAVAGLGGLVGLALWTGLSIGWSPLPGLARDEALLTLFYALALSVPLLTLRTTAEGRRALALFIAAIAGTALVTALLLCFGDDPASFFLEGRFASPVTYANAVAAFFLLAYWPAVALAARREASIAIRAPAVGAAALVVTAWLATQSKGAGLGLAASALVFFAASPQRLRAAVPAVVAAGTAVAAAAPLTGPYRTEAVAADRRAGAAMLAVALAAAAIGAIYAAADRRIDLSPRARRATVQTVVAVLVVSVVVAVVTFRAAVAATPSFVAEQWETFKTNPDVEAKTHLADVGSNRYDFWRVALDEFREHPVAGIGARGFAAVYLQERESERETPRRAHSLPLDVLMEVGIVGFVLLALGVGGPLAAAMRSRNETAAAALAGGTLWLAHATVDWTWTLPAAGLPFFLLLGIGASGGGTSLERRVGFAAAAVTTAATLLLFAPPWLAARLVERATAPADLRPAQILDPVSAQPYLAEARLSPSPANLEPYAEAVEREPRDWQVRYEYGLALLAAGRKEDARVQLEEASRLWPGQQAIARALGQTR